MYIITDLSATKFFVVFFLENFPFDNDEPSGEDDPLGNRCAADRPPDGIYTHAHVYQQQRHRYAHIVARDADDGGRHCPSYAIEDALHSDFHHHEYLRIAVDAQVVATHAVGFGFGHEDGEDFVAEEDEEQGAECAEDARHPERGVPGLAHAGLLSGGVVLGDEGT